MKRRTIEALRNLAERPGTPAEGALALEILQRNSVEAAAPHGVNIPADFLSRMCREYSIPDFFKCDCGTEYRPMTQCKNTAEHERIRARTRGMFRKGDRVVYNWHAYSPNCPGTVTGHITPRTRGYANLWGWITVKFDHLKSPRQVPIWSEGECKLTKEPGGECAS